MHDAACTNGASLAALVERVATVPGATKAFDVPLAEAGRYGLDPALIERMRKLGLPARADASGVWLAGADLHYLGLRLGAFAEHLTAMSQWRTTLERLAAEPPARATVEYLPLAAGCAERFGEVADVLLPGGDRRACRLDARKPVACVERCVRAAWPPLPEVAADVLERVGALDFYLLPPALVDDVERVRALGLADCEASARLTVEDLRAVGQHARIAHGLLLSVPYSRRHAWAEVRVSGEWVPVDPLLLSALHRFSGLDAAAWPVTRSPGAALLKLSEVEHPPVSVGGAEVETVFWTSVETAAPDAASGERRDGIPYASRA